MTITKENIDAILRKHVRYNFNRVTGQGAWIGTDRAASEIQALAIMPPEAPARVIDSQRILIETWVDPNLGDIYQSTDGLVRQVLKARSEQTRAALISLGWTPPEGKA